MSRSSIDCKKCHTRLAIKHHSGRIVVDAGVKVVLLSDGRTLLECRCGERRVLEARPQKVA